MKKYFVDGSSACAKWAKTLLTAAALIAATSLTACGGDDDGDEPKPNPGDTSDYKSLLCSTAWENERGEYGYIFNSDGTGYGFEEYGDDEWTITYKIRDRFVIITEEDGDKESFEIISISKQSLEVRFDGHSVNTKLYPSDWKYTGGNQGGGDDEPDEPDGNTCGYTDSQIEEMIVGTWRYKEVAQAISLYANGKGVIFTTSGSSADDITFHVENGYLIYDDGGSGSKKVEIIYLSSAEMTWELPSGTKWHLTRDDSLKPGEPYANSPILGTWECSSFDGEAGLKLTLTFNADGSAKEVMSDSGDTMTWTGSFEYKDNTLKWNVTDGLIENTYGYAGTAIEVKKLTSTQLVLSNKYGDSNTFKKK